MKLPETLVRGYVKAHALRWLLIVGATPLVRCGGDPEDSDENVPPSPTVDCASTKPMVSILEPETLSSFRPDAEITLRGEVTDPDTSDLSSLVVTWIVSGSAGVGTTDDLTINTSLSESGITEAWVSNLEEGEYVVTLEAIDACDNVSNASVEFAILNEPPEVTFDSVSDDEVVQYGEVTFRGVAFDPDDAAGTLQVLLIDDKEYRQGLEAEINEDGEWSVTASFGSPGEHSIFAVASDPFGKSGQSVAVVLTVLVPIPI